MFQTMLVLSAAITLAPAQGAPLTISNDRITFCGEFGPSRPNAKFLPGDLFFLAFDMENLKMDGSGKVQYSMGMEVFDSTNKSIFSVAPTNHEEYYPLGGGKVAARAYFDISTKWAPGMHTCKVTMTDRVNGASKTLEKPFEVLPPAFGMVAMLTSYDDKGEVAAPLMGFPGQALHLHFFVVGFSRDATTRQPHVVAEIRVLDQNDKPTIEQPLALMYNKGVEEKDAGLPFTFPLLLNRAGIYKLEVKADDKISGKSYKVSFPVTVAPSAK
jgi:hypothetical protein